MCNYGLKNQESYNNNNSVSSSVPELSPSRSKAFATSPKEQNKQVTKQDPWDIHAIPDSLKSKPNHRTGESSKKIKSSAAAADKEEVDMYEYSV